MESRTCPPASRAFPVALAHKLMGTTFGVFINSTGFNSGVSLRKFADVDGFVGEAANLGARERLSPWLK
jgi:hypothetical protein